MMEVIRSSESAVLIQATRRNIQQKCIYHSYRRDNLKSYITNEVYLQITDI
jgi:hypothetical protein